MQSLWRVALISSLSLNGQAAHAVDAPPPRTLVLLYADHLKPAAEDWSAYRRSEAGGGWRVVLRSVKPLDDQSMQRQELQQFIRQAHRENAPANPSAFAVLLLGDADDSGGGGGIPAWTFQQHDPVLQSRDTDDFISDHPYQLADDADDSPDFALGRVPAQTVEEARTVLDKIKSYERAPLALVGRNRITYTAGEGHFGAMDGVLESLFKNMVDRLVPDSFDLSMTYAKASSIYCPPPSKLTDSVLQRLSEGALLFNYVGHGHATGLDSLYWNDKRFPILRVADLKRLPHVDGAQLPIAYLSCCSAGWFDLPKGEHSLAEELLFHPVGGAVAVIAGSHITHPYANTVLQMDVTRALLVDRAPTVGMLDLLATQSLLKIGPVDRELDAIATPIALTGKWQTTLMGLRQMHVKLYNLLGDPATRINLPRQITDLKLNDSHLSGRVDGMNTGRVTATIETQRTSQAQPDKLQPLNVPNDPDLETKAAVNYSLANDRVLLRLESNVINGQFVLELPVMPANAAVLRVCAIGMTDSGEVIDAIGALRLTPSAATQSAIAPVLAK